MSTCMTGVSNYMWIWCQLNCKVALATLYVQSWHEFKMADTLQWTRLYPDYLRRIKVSRRDAYLELCRGDMRVQGGLYRLARIRCHVEQGPNGVYYGTGRCLARFLRCFEVYHDLDRLDVLYRGIHAYCSLQLYRNHVVSRSCSEYRRPCFLSKPSAVTVEWIAWLFSLSWCIYAGVVHSVIPSFLA